MLVKKPGVTYHKHMGTEVLPQFLLLVNIVIAVIAVALVLLILLWHLRYRATSAAEDAAQHAEAKTNRRTGWMLLLIVACCFLALQLIGPIYRLLFVGS